MANHRRTYFVGEKSKMNPFEIHINKQKMAILGQKTKNDRGLPGISRAKALTKRKQTILQEFKLQHKCNQFTDRRIGERSRDLHGEDKVIARFAAIRKRAHKKSIYNLSTDHFLTHKGQNLSEIEKFDDPRSEDEDDDSQDERENKSLGLLDSKFVSDAHFGGGVLKKTEIEGAKSHRDLIDELIAESKKRKAEKQKTKEATLELTEKLDSEWKDLFPLVNKKKTRDEENQERREKMSEQAPMLVDDYDKVMRELRFEERGTVSDRLKTEDEKANEEKESFRALEEERVMRMKDDFNKTKQASAHRSADDLDDDFAYTQDLSDEQVTLSYNEAGEANLEIDVEFNNHRKKFRMDDDENVQLDEDDDSDDYEDGDGKQDENLDESFSDLDIDSGDEESTCEDKESTSVEAEIKQESKNYHIISDNNTPLLPDACSITDSYDSFLKQLENYSVADQNTVITKIIKQHLLNRSAENKNKLRHLFAHLLQYLDDCACKHRAETCFETFSTVAPHLFELSQVDKENAYFSLKRLVEEMHDDYKKRPKIYPNLKVLLILKLVGLLFPTSDFRHQVVTPCLVFMEQMLRNCKVTSQRDVSFGLFLVTLVAEYTALSRRYLPASVQFLGGLLHMAIPKVSVKLVKVNSPFRPTSNFLVLSNDCSREDTTDVTKLKMCFSDLFDNTVDNSFKVRVIYTTVRLIRDFDRHFMDLPSNVEIFRDVVAYLELLPFTNYPKLVQKELENILQQLNLRRNHRSLRYIVSPQQKPKALRLHEPKVEQIFDGAKKRRNVPKEKIEREKLLHKLKKETKGALREIRRDKAFLGRVKLQQRLKGDRERRHKVKQIYSEAAMQQSELNSLKRKNK